MIHLYRQYGNLRKGSSNRVIAPISNYLCSVENGLKARFSPISRNNPFTIIGYQNSIRLFYSGLNAASQCNHFSQTCFKFSHFFLWTKRSSSQLSSFSSIQTRLHPNSHPSFILFKPFYSIKGYTNSFSQYRLGKVTTLAFAKFRFFNSIRFFNRIKYSVTPREEYVHFRRRNDWADLFGKNQSNQNQPHHQNEKKIAVFVLLLVTGGGFYVYVTNLEIVPYTKRRHLILISPQLEKQMGESAFYEVKSKFRGQILPEKYYTTIRIKKIAENIINAAIAGVASENNHINAVSCKTVEVFKEDESHHPKQSIFTLKKGKDKNKDEGKRIEKKKEEEEEKKTEDDYDTKVDVIFYDNRQNERKKSNVNHDDDDNSDDYFGTRNDMENKNKSTQKMDDSEHGMRLDDEFVEKCRKSGLERGIEGRMDHLNNLVWEILVIENDMPNAFCLPGGKIVVFTGLLKICKMDDEIATVLGHEVAHVVARHGAERVTTSFFLSIFQMIAFVLFDVPGSFRVLSDLLLTLPNSRMHELEADRVGLMLMAAAGYNPIHAPAVYTKLAQLQGSPEWAQYVQTHPSGNKRAQLLSNTSTMREALRIYEEKRTNERAALGFL